MKIHSIKYHRNGSDADSFYCVAASDGKTKDLLMTFEAEERNGTEEVIRSTVRVLDSNNIAFTWQGGSFKELVDKRLNYLMAKKGVDNWYALTGLQLDKCT